MEKLKSWVAGTGLWFALVSVIAGGGAGHGVARAAPGPPTKAPPSPLGRALLGSSCAPTRPARRSRWR